MTARRAGRRTPSPWGTVEQLPSGRWRASYRKDAERFAAPATFESKDDAAAWLAAERADRSRGTWRDPRQARVTLAEYAQAWMDSRPDLSPRTRDTYRRVLARWVLPAVSAPGRPRRLELGPLPLAEITPTLVRAWYAALFAAERAAAEARAARDTERRAHPARAWARARGMEVAATGALSPAVLAAWRAAGSPVPPTSPAQAAGRRISPDDSARNATAHAYRLLRAMLNTAAKDGAIPASPCQVAGAGTVHPRERSTAGPAEVAQLAALMPPRLAAAVILAAWSGLRYGELFALARRHVDAAAGTLRVERALVCVPGKPIGFGKTKTAKSARTVHLPGFAAAALAEHLAEHTPASPDALVFAMPDGSPVTGARLSRMFRRARQAIGRPDLTWHDLRHTGATLAYRAGASVPEVQARLGHTTMRAALIYAHTADDSDRVLADRLNAMFADAAAGAPRLRAV